jgi:hypothetical protein
MTGRQVLWKVEVPLGLPLLIGGIRSATLQVVATVTIATYVGLGGLGFYIIQGIQLRDTAQILGASSSSSPRPRPRRRLRARCSASSCRAASPHGAGRAAPAARPAALTSSAPHPTKGTPHVRTAHLPPRARGGHGAHRHRPRPHRLRLQRLLEGPAATGAATGSSETITIGSQAYYSNEIIAEIYAQALEGAGFTVDRKFNIGQRDAIIPSLQNGTIR